ncbi:LysR family transcriptional regulator [Acetobacter orientalis]|uniref:LysR family transcriptional regulator n=1 Tax=Acetobacter orientalis TaxID=146474 RepID=A0A252A093_9PROT|nr:LysR substrate-binding domain-containing protein [Acetobacter orientalis]OUI80498.1 LysR family transcriptional regulator [Acetobacter orientalis]
MELRHLHYFVVLAEELHFARAAERLNISPPTLTVQIQEIERRLAAQLFTRTRRSVALTSVGKVFLGEAQQVLEQFTKAENAGRRAGRGELGRIEIGYVGSAAYTGVLQEQMKQFTQKHPGVHLNACEFPMDSLPQRIAAGEVDVGFVRLPMTLPPQLRQHVLVRDHFCLAVPVGFWEGGSEHCSVLPEQISDASFVMPEQSFGTFQVASRGNFTPKIVSAPGSLLAVLTQVSIGNGIAVCPSIVRSIIKLPNVALVDISGEPIISEVAAIFRFNEPAPTVKNMISQILTTDVTIQ